MNKTLLEKLELAREISGYKLPVLIGTKEYDGREIILEFDNVDNVAIFGTSGSGKSWAIFNLLYNLVLNNGKYIIMDYKREYCYQIISKSNRSLGYYTEPLDYTRILGNIENEIEIRKEIMSKLGVCRWRELFDNKEIIEEHPFTFVVIEEFAALLAKLEYESDKKELKDEFIDKLQLVMKKSRTVGIKFILVSQRNTDMEMSKRLQNECSMKLLFKLPDVDLERLGVDIKHSVNEAGKAILVIEQNGPVVIKTNKIADSERDLIELIESL